MVGQSERLPMMMATGGVVVLGIGVEVPLAAAGLKAAPYARQSRQRKCKTPCAPWKRAPRVGATTSPCG
jgi:hypothetical protein